MSWQSIQCHNLDQRGRLTNEQTIISIPITKLGKKRKKNLKQSHKKCSFILKTQKEHMIDIWWMCRQHNSREWIEQKVKSSSLHFCDACHYCHAQISSLQLHHRSHSVDTVKLSRQRKEAVRRKSLHSHSFPFHVFLSGACACILSFHIQLSDFFYSFCYLQWHKSGRLFEKMVSTSLGMTYIIFTEGTWLNSGSTHSTERICISFKKGFWTEVVDLFKES